MKKWLLLTLLIFIASLTNADTTIATGTPAFGNMGGRSFIVNSSMMYALYHPNASAQGDLFIARSVDSGVTWDNDWVRLNNRSAACNQSAPGTGSIKFYNGYIYAAFVCREGVLNGGGINIYDQYYARLDSNGAFLNHSLMYTPGGNSNPYSPDVTALTNGTVFYTYVGAACISWGYQNIVMQSNDNGATWFSSTTLHNCIDSNKGSGNIALSTDGTYAYIYDQAYVSGLGQSYQQEHTYTGTWNTTNLFALGTYTCNANSCKFPSVAISGVRHLLYYDGSTTMYYLSSANWSAITTLGSGTFGQISAEGSTLVASYIYGATYVRKNTTDNGNTWTTSNDIAEACYSRTAIMTDNNLADAIYYNSVGAFYTNDTINTITLAGYNHNFTLNSTFVANRNISSSLSLFPAWVSVDSRNKTLFNITTCLNAKFTDSNVSTFLNCSYESGCGTNNTLYICQIPVQENNTQIKIWLGNSTALSCPYYSSAVTQNIWRTANYVGRYSMEANGTQNDSAGYNNLAQGGNCAVTTGKFGNGILFSQCGYNKTSPTGLPSGSASSTETVFLKVISHNSQTVEDFYAYGENSNNKQRGLGIKNGAGLVKNLSFFGYNMDYTSNILTPNTTFSQVGTQLDSGTISVIMNGTLSSKSGQSPNTGATKMTLGYFDVDGLTYGLGNSVVDEYRIRSTASTADWLNAENNLIYNANIDELNYTCDGIRHHEYSIIANTTMLYSTSAITSNMTNFTAWIKLDSTNTTLFNVSSSCLNARFYTLDAVTNLQCSYESGCGTNSTYYICQIPTQSNNTQIKVFLGNLFSASMDSDCQFNTTATNNIWRQANYISRYGFEATGTQTDSAGLNTLTMTGNCPVITGLHGNAINLTGGCYFSNTAPTGFPVQKNVSTDTAWANMIAHTNDYEILWSYGSSTDDTFKRGLIPKFGASDNYYAFPYDYFDTGAVHVHSKWTMLTLFNMPNVIFKINDSANSSTSSLIGNLSGINRFRVGTQTYDPSVGTQYVTNTGIDELRIRNVTSTDDWIKAEYALEYSTDGNSVVNRTVPTTAIGAIAPSPAYNISNLNASVNCTVTTNDTLKANFTWYKNGTSIITYDTQVNCTNATACYTDKLVNETLIIGDNWTASAICYDGFAYSLAWENSTNVTITSAGNVTITYGTGIYSARFEPTEYNQTINATNQTAINGLYNLTNNDVIVACIKIKTNATMMPNVVLRCSPYGNFSSSIILNTTWQDLISINASNSNSVWCQLTVGDPDAWTGQGGRRKIMFYDQPGC